IRRSAVPHARRVALRCDGHRERTRRRRRRHSGRPAAPPRSREVPSTRQGLNRTRESLGRLARLQSYPIRSGHSVVFDGGPAHRRARKQGTSAIWNDSNRLARRGQLSGAATKKRAVQGMTGNTKSTWGAVSRWFHWILGLAIIGLIAYGWWMNHMTARPDRFFHRSIHSDIGYVVLVLTVVRLIWRGVNPTPDLPGATP